MPLWLRRSFSVSAKKIHGLGKGMGSLLGNFDFDITPEINFISVNKQFKIILIIETLIAIFSLFFIYPPIFK